MPARIQTSKALCYIVREDQLLVFRHTDYDLEHVGIQVPAGTIGPEDAPQCFWIPLQDADVLQAGQGALIGVMFDDEPGSR
jgi:hypothetical protein